MDNRLFPFVVSLGHHVTRQCCGGYLRSDAMETVWYLRGFAGIESESTSGAKAEARIPSEIFPWPRLVVAGSD